MRLVFVAFVREDRGSAQTLRQYARTASALGHEIVLYRAAHSSILENSVEIGPRDAAVFIFESTQRLQEGDALDLLRIVGRVRRRRRVVIDCDGNYNDAISVGGDLNHPDEDASRRWVNICDSLSDKIYQPTIRPLSPNARPFLFYGYSPDWELPLGFGDKRYGMVYVGNNWFRWRSLRRLLESIEPIREHVGAIGLVGNWWVERPVWADDTFAEDAFDSDPEFLARLDVEVLPPVPFYEVVRWMSKAVFSPVLLRPLLDHLRLVTPRMFETPAASTIPLFAQDDAYLEAVYGESAPNLSLPRQEPGERILDVLRRPEHYADFVQCIRDHLRAHHSFECRLRELIDIVES